METREMARDEAQAVIDRMTERGFANYAVPFVAALGRTDAPTVEVTMAKWAWKDTDSMMKRGYITVSRGVRLSRAYGSR